MRSCFIPPYLNLVFVSVKPLPLLGRYENLHSGPLIPLLNAIAARRDFDIHLAIVPRIIMESGNDIRNLGPLDGVDH